MDNGDYQQLLSSDKIKSWSVSYENLITDEAGIRRFREYLNGNGSGDGSSKMSKRLEFTFVVHGYRSMQEPKEMVEAARSIWKRFVNRSDLQCVLKKETFDKISAFIKSLDNPLLSDSLIRNAFNEAQEEVHESLANSAYRSFLNSDDYGKLLNHAKADECDANFSHRQFPHPSSTHPPHASHRFHHPPPPPPHANCHISHNSSNGNTTALSYIDQNSSASNASFKAADEINASNAHRSQNSMAKTRKTIHPPHPPRQLEPLPENSDVKIASNNSLHVPSNTLNKLPQCRLKHLYNPTVERYQYQYRGLPPHPYHVEYSTVLPTSAQDSELASYSSGATRSDVASSVDERPFGPISKRELKHQEKTIRHDLNVNQAVRAGGVEQNKSKHFVPSHPPKTPNPEKEHQQFFDLISEKLNRVLREQENNERLTKALDLQSANPYETLKALTNQEESQAILDSHVRKWSDWGDPTPPIDHSGNVSPLPTARMPSSNWGLRPTNSHLAQDRPHNRTLPRSYPHPHPQILNHHPLNNQISAADKVTAWCQKDTSSVNKKKSSHSVHSGSTKSAKNKSGERAKGVGQSCSNLAAMERPTGENKVTETIIVYTYEDEKNDKKNEEIVPTRIRIPKRNVTLQEFKDRLPKKGSYKYYFKVYDEVVEKNVMEECTNDNQVLPNISKDNPYVLVSIRPAQ